MHPELPHGVLPPRPEHVLSFLPCACISHVFASLLPAQPGTKRSASAGGLQSWDSQSAKRQQQQQREQHARGSSPVSVIAAAQEILQRNAAQQQLQKQQQQLLQRQQQQQQAPQQQQQQQAPPARRLPPSMQPQQPRPPAPRETIDLSTSRSSSAEPPLAAAAAAAPPAAPLGAPTQHFGGAAREGPSSRQITTGASLPFDRGAGATRPHAPISTYDQLKASVAEAQRHLSGVSDGAALPRTLHAYGAPGGGGSVSTALGVSPDVAALFPESSRQLAELQQRQQGLGGAGSGASCVNPWAEGFLSQPLSSRVLAAQQQLLLCAQQQQQQLGARAGAATRLLPPSLLKAPLSGGAAAGALGGALNISLPPASALGRPPGYGVVTGGGAGGDGEGLGRLAPVPERGYLRPSGVEVQRAVKAVLEGLSIAGDQEREPPEVGLVGVWVGV